MVGVTPYFVTPSFLPISVTHSINDISHQGGYLNLLCGKGLLFMRILLVGPTALDSKGNPIKQRKLHLPGLTLPMLAAVTPRHYEVRLVSETVEDIPFAEHWDLVGITGMGSGIVRAW